MNAMVAGGLATPSAPDRRVTIREAAPDDWYECGRICYEAFAAVADRHGLPHDFPTVTAAA